MLRTLKWIYKLGYEQAEQRIIRILESARDFELSQAQLKARVESDDLGFKHKTSPQEHDSRYQALCDVLNHIDPEEYPNIDKFLELLK